MAVKKIELGTVEANLRNVSSSAETIRRLQEEIETLSREYERERIRYRTGEIAKDVFESLTRAHKKRMETINRKIAALIVTSTNSLNRLSTLVADHMPARRTARRRVRRRVTRRRRTTRRKTARRRTTRRRTRKRRTTRRRTRRRRRRR
ncbi:MAG: hypothetical protein ACE5J4_00895 [Candidatus Aenigmatarchaeota archaeon]